MEAQFWPKTDVTECCDTEEGVGRYALKNVAVSPGRKKNEVWLTASNGKCFAAVKVEGHADAPSLCPREIVSQSQQAKSPVVLDGGIWKSSQSETPCAGGRFPKIANMPPKHGDDPILLCLNTELLDRIRKAISSDEFVTLIIPRDSVIVEHGVAVLGTEEGFGIIAPAALQINNNGPAATIE